MVLNRFLETVETRHGDGGWNEDDFRSKGMAFETHGPHGRGRPTHTEPVHLFLHRRTPTTPRSG